MSDDFLQSVGFDISKYKYIPDLNNAINQTWVVFDAYGNFQCLKTCGYGSLVRNGIELDFKYVSKNGKVWVQSFAQIGLQEHSKNMVGNAAVLINGYYQYGNPKEIEKQMKKFLEDIGYQGFAEFDLKYDYRDKKFKVLEINARQGRSSYYITPLGCNLVKVLIDDLIHNKEMNYKFLTEQVLLSFVPKGIIKKYIVNEEYKKVALKLWKSKVVNPIKYKKDNNFKRNLYLTKKHFRYYKEYKNGYWKVS